MLPDIDSLRAKVYKIACNSVRKRFSVFQEIAVKKCFQKADWYHCSTLDETWTKNCALFQRQKMGNFSYSRVFLCCIFLFNLLVNFQCWCRETDLHVPHSAKFFTFLDLGNDQKKLQPLIFLIKGEHPYEQERVVSKGTYVTCLSTMIILFLLLLS